MLENDLLIKFEPTALFNCCGKDYNTKNEKDLMYFRAFFHKNIEKNISAAYCLSIWFCCKNNNCIKTITFFINSKGRKITEKTVKGIKYLMLIQQKFLADYKLSTEVKKDLDVSNKYLWKYAKSRDGIKQEIYDFNNKRVG